jgi:hypothetical protein
MRFFLVFLLFAAACANAQTITQVRTKAKAPGFVATVTWTCTCVNHDGFNVYRKTGTAGIYAKVGTTQAATMKFTDPGLKPNTIYVYQIGAFNQYSEIKGSETVAETGKPHKKMKT